MCVCVWTYVNYPGRDRPSVRPSTDYIAQIQQQKRHHCQRQKDIKLRLIYTIHSTLYTPIHALPLDLAGVRNQIIRHGHMEVVLREAGVESHDALELLVLADGDVDGRLDDEPGDGL